MKRRLLALVLVVSLVASMCTTAFAAQADAKEEINYVSLGDSMTNGYCFTGYDQGNITPEQFKNGQKVYGNDAYPNEFAAWLATETGKTVNHKKLAVSAMRAEDLNYLLGGREMPIDGWFGQVEHYSGTSGDALKGIYQEAIADADMITMSIGNAAFGAYLVQYFTRMMGVMGGSLPADEKVDLEKALSTLDAEKQAIIMEAYNEMLAEVKKYDSLGLAENEKLMGMVDLMTYVSVGFLLNYEGVLDQIVELNPDVEIVLIGLMNTTYGMEITGEDFDPIAIGDIMDTLFGALNAYIAGLPAAKHLAGEWTEAKFYYADQPNPEFIVQVFDDLYNEGWPADYHGLSGATVRSRTIKAYNEALAPMIGAAILGFPLPAVTLAEVQSYVFDTEDEHGNGSGYSYQVQNQFMAQVAQYTGANANELPLVKRYTEATGDYYLANVESKFATVFAADIEKEISIAIYLALEESLAKSVDSMEITLEGLMGIAGDILGALGEMPEELAGSPGPFVIKNALIEWFTGSETALAMCKIFAMFKVGDGMSVHPTPKAHAKMADAVINAYANGYTVEDETIENLTEVAKIVADLVTEYYDEAYAYAYDYAEEQGYIEATTDGIDEVIATLEAIDVSGTEMTDEFKAELDGEIAKVIETLEAAKALITEADVLNQDSLDALMAMLNEADEAIANIQNLLKQAGVDVNDLVIVPALEKAYDKLVNEVIPAAEAAAEEIAAKAYEYLVALAEQAGEDLAEAYDAFVEAFLEFLPEADAWLYDWFYNNPDKVIAFFEENGEFFVENAEAAATVLGYIAYTFGPEVLEWVMENPEEALEQFVSWYEKYGERTWAMILVYLEELGVIDAAEDLYSCIEDALADLYEQLEDCTDEAYADIMEQIEVLRAQLDALRAEIEAAASELNAAIYEQLMKGLDEIDALLNELEAIVKGEVEASIEEIKALIAEMDAAIEDLLKTIANDVEGTVQAAIQAAVEAIKEQLSYIDGAAEWLEEAVAEAYEAFIDALLEALPYIDEALYDFFYNNPDKVIAFFEENSEFFAENAEAVLAVLGYIAVEFGDDALEYVLNNPEEALEQFVSWYEKYGERTWAMILVYLNELGVLDCLPTEEDVKAAIEAIEKQIEDCYKQLENATGEALEELEATIEELKAAVEELKAMVEDYAQMLDAAVRAEIDAAIEKLENAVAELETAVEELKAAIEAQIEEAIAKAEAAVKEALAKVEEAIAKVEAVVNGVIADVNETIKEIYAALENAKEELVAGAAQIVENLKDALADLYDVIVENADKIDDAVLAEIIAAIEDIEDALEKLDAIIKGAADAAIEDVAAELKSALAELQDAVEALIEAV